MNKYALALDLQDDEQLIAAYEAWHTRVWPEVKQSILESGITGMEIYRFANRLFMIMETNDDFSFERKAAADQADPRIQEWENMLWNYQKSIPGSKPGEKWVLMNKIFDLNAVNEL